MSNRDTTKYMTLRGFAQVIEWDHSTVHYWLRKTQPAGVVFAPYVLIPTQRAGEIERILREARNGARQHGPAQTTYREE